MAQAETMAGPHGPLTDRGAAARPGPALNGRDRTRHHHPATRHSP